MKPKSYSVKSVLRNAKTIEAMLPKANSIEVSRFRKCFCVTPELQRKFWEYIKMRVAAEKLVLEILFAKENLGPRQKAKGNA